MESLKNITKNKIMRQFFEETNLEQLIVGWLDLRGYHLVRLFEYCNIVNYRQLKKSLQRDPLFCFIIETVKIGYCLCLMTTQQPYLRPNLESFQELELFSRFSEDLSNETNHQHPHKVPQNKSHSFQKTNKSNHNIHKQQRNPNINPINKAQNDSHVIECSENINRQILILQSEIQSLNEAIVLIKKNHLHEIIFYGREQYRVLLTLNEFMKRKQYQRIEECLEVELAALVKKFGNEVTNMSIAKPSICEDNRMGSRVEEDPCFKKLVSNFSENIRDTNIESINILPIIRKLSQQKQLSIKKLSWYLTQAPFQISQKSESQAIAKKIISEMGCDSGIQIVNLIEKKIENPKGIYQRSQLATSFKSQISQIIASHTLYDPKLQ